MMRLHSRASTFLRRFARQESGATAIEFALVSSPLFLLILGLLQVGLYYATQAALDGGTTKTVEALHTSFHTGTSATLPTASALKASLVTNAGGLINNNASLLVEVRQLSALTSGAVAIVDGTTDYGSITSVLVLRAKASVTIFAPGFGSLAFVQSSAIVRRQGT